MRTRVGRTWTRYTQARGPLMAKGLSYQAIFAVFAALWVVFALVGFIVRDNEAVRMVITRVFNAVVPGLVENASGPGVASLNDLLSASVLGWTGVIALIGFVVTAISWPAAARGAIRTIAGVPDLPTNAAILKARDALIALAVGVALVVSASLSIASTTALARLYDLVGVDDSSWTGVALTRAVGIVLTFLLDAVLLAVLYRLFARLPVPWRILAPGVALGAVALGALKLLGALVLGGASSNPLLASFAVILGLLIWFALVGQVFLLTAAWIAESAHDAGVRLDPETDADAAARRGEVPEEGAR